MLAYAANRQRIAARGASPPTMLFIVGAHVAVIAVAMTMKIAVDERQKTTPTVIRAIPLPEVPPPVPQADPERPQQRPAESTIDRPKVEIATPKTSETEVDLGPPVKIDTGPLVGTGPQTPPVTLLPPRILEPVRTGPRLDTPQSALRPPYPASKLDTQQEASLRLKLSIDERGRVIAVEPVGRVDRAFFESARRHLVARWRYQPATVDGQAVPSSTVITLRFELEG